MAKAPIYKQYAHNPAASRIQAIQEIANQLKGQCPDELHSQLDAAIYALEQDSAATKTIMRGGNPVRYAVDKSKKPSRAIQ